MAVSGSISEAVTERIKTMNNKKARLDQISAQQLRRQEKQLAFEKQQQKKAYAKLNKQICAAVYDVFPELKTSIASNSGELACEVLEQIENIKLVLQYFSTHPRVLDSLRTGVLPIGRRTDV